MNENENEFWQTVFNDALSYMVGGVYGIPSAKQIKDAVAAASELADMAVAEAVRKGRIGLGV